MLAVFALLGFTPSRTPRALWREVQDPRTPATQRGATMCALAENLEAVAPAALLEDELAATVAKTYGVQRGCAFVQLYNESARLGNATAQFRFAVITNAHSPCTQRKAAEVLWLLHFAATGGHRGAQLAVGYRYLHGVGVEQSCERAARWYQIAANSVVDDLRARGMLAYRSREAMGVHAAAARTDATWMTSSGSHLLSMYQHAIDRDGDAETVVGATMLMGRALYYGLRGAAVDHARAAGFFEAARARGHRPASRALAHMYLCGHGVPQSNETALAYFREAGDDGEAKNGLGVMQLTGAGASPNPKRALELIRAAAAADSVAAHYNLAVLHLQGASSGVTGLPRNWREAARLFTIGANAGDTLSMHQLALMRLNGLGGLSKSCSGATKALKTVAERGETATLLGAAWEAHRAGRARHALLLYSRAAEMGYQLAQSNAAELLEERAVRQDVFACGGGARACARRALDFHTEAARQGSVAAQVRRDVLCASAGGGPDGGSRRARSAGGDRDGSCCSRPRSHRDSASPPSPLSPLLCLPRHAPRVLHACCAQLRIGDFHYAGAGGGEPDFVAAAEHYRVGESQRSAEAMFNLGWMCQRG